MYYIRAVLGDITKANDTQAVVNAAGNGCEAGEAKMTKGASLSDHIIHTVGPVWQGGRAHEHELLAGCYFHSMQLAMENGIRSVAFPSISTGADGYPVDLAAKVAVRTVVRFLKGNPDAFDLVEWVLSDETTLKTYEKEVDLFYET